MKYFFSFFFSGVLLCFIVINYLVGDPESRELKYNKDDFVYDVPVFNENGEFRDTLDIKLHYKQIKKHYNLPESHRGIGQFITRDDKSVYNYYKNYYCNNSNSQKARDIGYWGVAWYFNREEAHQKALNYLNKVEDTSLKYYSSEKGRALLYLGRIDEATAYMEEALTNEEDTASLWPLYIRVKYHQKDYDALDSLYTRTEAGTYFPEPIRDHIYLVQGRYGRYFSNLFQWSFDGIGTIAFGLVLIVWMLFLISLKCFQRPLLEAYLLALGLGAGFTLIAPFWYDVIIHLLDFRLTGNVINDLLFCIVGIGFWEELIKLVPFLIVLAFFYNKVEPVDYIILAGISALGFAFMENVMKFSRYGFDIIQVRSYTATIAHVFDSSIIAYSLILARYRDGKGFSVLYLLAGFGIAVLSHALYDFWLLNETVRVFLLYSFVILIAGMLLLSSFINNALNNAPSFDYKKALNPALTGRLLAIGLTGIMLTEYLIQSLKEGISEANQALFTGFLFPIAFIGFLSRQLSDLDLVKGYWEPLNFHTFFKKYNKNQFIGKRATITGNAQNKVLGNAFPLSGKVESRILLSEELNNFLFVPDTPLVEGDRELTEFVIKFSSRNKIKASGNKVFVFEILDAALLETEIGSKDQLRYLSSGTLNFDE